jgi:L-threonylcarbamoyladenylate synthase
VAVRVSNHPVVSELTKLYNKPIVSTSANLAGEKPAVNALQVFSMFGDNLGDVIDAPLGEQAQPSQIFDAISGKKFR